MIDMKGSQSVGRVFVNFGYWYHHGTGCPTFCTNTKDHYVSMVVKVGDTSYSGYGHGSRVSGVNTRCVDHGTNKPSEWEMWFVCEKILTGRYVTNQKYDGGNDRWDI